MDTSARTAAGLQQLLTRVVESTGIPGICVTLLTDGRATSYACNHPAATTEPVSTSSRFEMACLGKPVLSALACDAIAAGQLDPDAPISRYLPELVGSKGDVIRLSHLLTHTTGCEGSNLASALGRSDSWEDLAASFRAAQQIFAPGTVFNYDNSEHAIVGEILQRLHGREPAQMMREELAGRLRLACGTAELDRANAAGAWVQNHVFNPESRRYDPAERETLGHIWLASLSDLTLTTQDLAQAAAMLLGLPGIDERQRGVPVESVRLFCRQVIGVPRSPDAPHSTAWQIAQGFGFALYADGSFGHNASTSGQCCAVRVEPRSRTAIAVGINANVAPVRDMVMLVLGRVVNPAAAAMAARPPALVSFTGDELAGHYTGGMQGISANVTATGDQLCCHTIVRDPNGQIVFQQDVLFRIGAQGEVRLEPASIQNPMWFFRENHTGIPCFMAGNRAYRRVTQPE